MIVFFDQKGEEFTDYILQNYALESLLHLRCLFAYEIFEKFTYAYLDAHLATVHHMNCQMSQKNVVIFLLEFAAKERSHILIVDVILQLQQITEDFDRVWF